MTAMPVVSRHNSRLVASNSGRSPVRFKSKPALDHQTVVHLLTGHPKSRLQLQAFGSSDSSLARQRTSTTGISSFAVCLKHTAKAILHSANALPSVTLGKERSTNCTSATASLPSTFCRALGKEKSPSRRHVTVTDPLPSAFCGTRQRGQFCRVFARETLGKD
jgi:hypothetical protein